MAIKYVQADKIRLNSTIGTTETSISVSNFKDIYGNVLDMDDFGEIGHLTIDPGVKDKRESISFSGVTDNGDGTHTLIGVIRGLEAKSDYGVGGTARDHSAGAKIIVTNTVSFLDSFVNKKNNETMVGYLGGPDPVSSNHYTTKQWVEALINGGTVSIDRIIVTAVAGETVAAGNLLYLNETDYEWYLADADTVAKLENVILGIAQGAGTNGANITNGVLVKGEDNNQSGGSVGDDAFASDTAGAIATSAGTIPFKVGFFKDADTIYFDPVSINSLTYREKQALAGLTNANPSSTNKFLTQDSQYSNTTDQTQTDDDSTTAFGEADSAGRRTTISQQFLASRSGISGVILKKKADTGDFTGTVTIDLLADSGSNTPTGSALATVTLTNTQWLNLQDDTTFRALFGTEYNSLTPGTLYWLRASTSTADNSNHPNLAFEADASAYSDGLMKYYNTTDGYVAVTGDLYFKTLEGTVSKSLKTYTDGRLSGVLKKPTIVTFTPNKLGDSTTRFDITNPSGTTFRYTYDGTGTDPGITEDTVPTGKRISIYSQNFNSNNNLDAVVVTASGANYFEVTNASGVAENDKTLSTGHFEVEQVYTPTDIERISYIVVEIQAGGGGGGQSGTSNGYGSAGGGAGNYVRKTYDKSVLQSAYRLLVGCGGERGGNVTGDGKPGSTAYFNEELIASGGLGGAGNIQSLAGTGGATASGGDFNKIGSQGGNGGSAGEPSGKGGDSMFAPGGASSQLNVTGNDGSKGSGGGGGYRVSGTQSGGKGGDGIIVITEHY